MSDAAGDAAARGGPRRLIGFVRSRLKGRPDGEHEIVLNRLVISLIVLIYVLCAGAEASVVALAGSFAACAVGFFAHMLWRPGTHAIRRLSGMVADLSALSCGIHLGGATTAILYPLYLWVIFGNGFRFGIPALYSAAAVGVSGFALAFAFTPFWHDNVLLSVGLLCGLIVLPTYAGSLIRKLQKAKETAEEAKDVAEEANRAKSRFLASVSHELRTPLNAVIGMTDLLVDTDLDAEQQEMARTAGESGRALLSLIDDLLNFSRLEAGRMPTNVTDFDLHEVLASARGMLTAQAQQKNLRLGLHVTPRTPYRLRGEARQIRDVLVNLIGNAVKFTESGGVVASVDLVGGTADRPRLRFEVADTGIGIAPEARARIFESFTQADATIINSHGGTGLGLAICRQLVELQGGRIDVDSQPGVGSVFWFELDLDAAPAGAAIAEMDRSALVVALASSEARADALVEMLADIGVKAEAALDVRAAVRALRADGGTAGRRVAVVDAAGSRSDGEALAAAIRAADLEGLIETALIDPGQGEGLPEVDLRLLCASVSPAPTRGQLGAMVRIASVGAVGRIGVRSEKVRVGPSARRLSILVAEDNRTNQKVITKVLEKAGHEVRIAENGELALDALTERAFDIVLMDVNMPVLDGVECTKLYRFASIGKKRTPIVALTADATPTARERCLEAGMDACLTKPIEPATLLAMIDELAGGEAGDGLERAEEASAAAELVDDEIVANIAKHPNFRPSARSVVDRRTLAALEELGGREFVGDLINAFIDEAAAVLKSLHEAVDLGEPGAFREQAHALRSGAANIGARGMYEICLSYRNLDARELAIHGAENVRRLEAEFDRVRKTLRRQFPDAEVERGA